ncbi:MAG: group II intron reverse transcriptase/maturase [Flavobacteriales bacterium]|nr:group II intron reverse transcriptase/maturase [Flavobacteriales bacterium]
MIFKEQTKSVPITRMMVWDAYKQVKRNKGSAGIDSQTLEEFAKVRSKELYKIWNRLASGSYFPLSVKRVDIPKDRGKTRPLGIPTVSDRIAQQVIKKYIEPRIDAKFMDNSYGYRPNKSAHDAIKEVRKNVLKYGWVIDLDIQEFFENVQHDLLLKALKVDVSETWVEMYISRWLVAPIQLQDGTLVNPKGKGTPQGGVISPLLSNLYLHYCIDKWLSIHIPSVTMIRYADDMVIHCSTQQEAEQVLCRVTDRLAQCGLQVHPQKTKIVYCKKAGRNLTGLPVQFDFLGFSFRPIMTKLRKGVFFLQYDCKMSRKSKKRILKGIRDLNLHRKTRSNLQDLAIVLNPKIRGWINYYGKVKRNSLKPVFYYLHHRIIKWILNKYKRFKGSRVLAVKWLRNITKHYPTMFYHWELGYQLT